MKHLLPAVLVGLARLDTEVHYSTDATLVRERLSENGLFPPPIGDSTYTQTDVSQNIAYNLDWWGRSRSQQQALQETERSRALARQRQEIGLAGPLDALVADSTVLGQEMNDTEIQAARLRAHVALFKAIGGDIKDPAP